MKQIVFSIVLCLFAAPLGLLAQEKAKDNSAIIEETVAKARAFLGGNKKLNAVSTIHLQGVIVYGNGQSGTFESVYKRPDYHQFISVIGTQKETSTLNKTEAWQKIENVATPGSWTLNFYGIDDLRHMQATVSEALSFLKTPPVRKGRIEYLGTEEVDGRLAQVLVYHHGNGIWFRRYIDNETGRVLRMINDKGVTFTEYGEKIVDGVWFPEKMVVSFRTQFGEQSMEISYSSITLNEKVDSNRFKVPAMSE